VKIPKLNMEIELRFSPFEIKTIAVDYTKKRWFETDLMEKKLELKK